MEIKSIRMHALRKINLGDESGNSKFSPLSFGKINIIIGPNGGGKSTLIDLIRSLDDAIVLSSIPRENMLNNTVSGFDISFSNGEGIAARFNCERIDTFGVHIKSVGVSGNERVFEGSLGKFSKKNIQEIEGVINNISTKIFYRNLHDASDIPMEDYIAVLNENAKHLNGLAPFPLEAEQAAYRRPEFTLPYYLEYPITKFNNELVHVAFNDDESQTNHVPISYFPSGWKAFGGLIGWLKQYSDCICVIEEPEVHLHPQLQRLLISQIMSISTKQNIQIFLTTHSPVFINASCVPHERVTLIEANGHRVQALTDAVTAISKLGVKPSDCLQANGIIWVEGPSDRIYILHWLTLFCKEMGVPMPVENLDFAFVLYGGAVLKHYTINGANYSNLIDMLKINANCIVVMDKDFDFDFDFDLSGKPMGEKNGSTKSQIDSDISADPTKLSWITNGYTIESYLPSSFFTRYFDNSSGKVVLKSGYSKVKIAGKFADKYTNFHQSYARRTDLSSRITTVFDLINKWKN